MHLLWTVQQEVVQMLHLNLKGKYKYKVLDFFYVPAEVKEALAKYFGAVKFTTKNYTTNWQDLEIGIMMGCVISALLFMMCMELILRGARDTVPDVELENGVILPPLRALMDDITSLIHGVY